MTDECISPIPTGISGLAVSLSRCSPRVKEKTKANVLSQEALHRLKTKMDNRHYTHDERDPITEKGFFNNDDIKILNKDDRDKFFEYLRFANINGLGIWPKRGFAGGRENYPRASCPRLGKPRLTKGVRAPRSQKCNCSGGFILYEDHVHFTNHVEQCRPFSKEDIGARTVPKVLFTQKVEEKCIQDCVKFMSAQPCLSASRAVLKGIITSTVKSMDINIREVAIPRAFVERVIKRAYSEVEGGIDPARQIEELIRVLDSQGVKPQINTRSDGFVTHITWAAPSSLKFRDNNEKYSVIVVDVTHGLTKVNHQNIRLLHLILVDFSFFMLLYSD